MDHCKECGTIYGEECKCPEGSKSAVDALVMPLARYGLQWNVPEMFVCAEMPDGYWTPWHIAQEELTTARRAAQYWKDNHLAGNAEIDRLRTALEKIASFTQDTNLLWWQEEARKALAA